MLKTYVRNIAVAAVLASGCSPPCYTPEQQQEILTQQTKALLALHQQAQLHRDSANITSEWYTSSTKAARHKLRHNMQATAISFRIEQERKSMEEILARHEMCEQ